MPVTVHIVCVCVVASRGKAKIVSWGEKDEARVETDMFYPLVEVA